MEGIVVIDEAEVYLHTRYQREVLPKLIKLFPKVQFVITTHSPAFLVGMNEQFGSEGFDICEMPRGDRISVDEFKEVSSAVEALTDTAAFRAEVRSAVASKANAPLLLVEGRSDAIIIEGIWRIMTGADPSFQILAAKGCRGLRYLLQDEQFISEVGATQKVLGVFDFDAAYDDWNSCTGIYTADYGTDATGLLKQHPTKGIFAGLLPVPQFRALQAGSRFGNKSSFTIELYVPDEVLQETNNLATDEYPGGFQAVRFRGDKVSFAQRISQDKRYIAYYEPLIAMIRSTLGV